MVICTQPIPPLSDNDKNHLKRMFGSFLREVAALVFVFPILEKVVFSHHISFWYTFWTYVLAVGVLIFGLGFGVKGGDDDDDE